MSAAKHTPGPWIVEANGQSLAVKKNFRVDHHMDICGSVHGYMYAENEKENQLANARLIAAAPDLLAALQAVRHLVVTYSTLEEFGQVRAAIAKATGAEL